MLISLAQTPTLSRFPVNELAKKRTETVTSPHAVIPCCRFHRHRRGRCHHSNQYLHLCAQDLPKSERHTKKNEAGQNTLSFIQHCNTQLVTDANLRNRSVVPNVALVWENVGNKSQLALLHILLNRVQKVFCGNLKTNCTASSKPIGADCEFKPDC